MRIALFWDFYGPYHFARLDGALAAARAEGHVVSAIELAEKSSTYAWARERQPPGCSFTTLFPGETAEQISSRRVFLAMRRHLQANPVDVLFVPSYWPGYVFAATLAARSSGARVVIMAESHYATGRNNGMLVAVKRLLVGLYSSAMVGGSAQRSFFRYLGMPETHIVDGYDVVDNDYFSNNAIATRNHAERIRAELNLPSKYILSLGRFVAKKNLDTVLEGYAKMVNAGRSAGRELVFVGAGPLRSKLVDLAHELRLDVVHHDETGAVFSAYSGPERRRNRGAISGGRRHEDRLAEREPGKSLGVVHFYPFAQIDKTPVFYALAECFTLASRFEEWGLVVNESMASGCPVIVSRVVGCSHDLVENGKTGFRFNPDNSDELAWYLGQICESPQMRADMAEAAHKRIAEWGPARFGENAIVAAKAALQARKGTPAGAEHEKTVILLQTSFPDYRIPVYTGISKSFGGQFKLYTGMEYFTPDVRTCAEFRPWIIMVKNSFLAGRRFLWQGDAVSDVLGAEVAIMELNPRILSNWLILFTRALWARPTILWGHAWGRDGESSTRNLLRLLMMRGATSVITYTNSQKAQLKAVLPKMHISAAPNSSVRRIDCIADISPPDQLTMILYVGRLNAAKNPMLLLDGFSMALGRLPSHIKLCYVGTGVERAGLEARVQELGLGGRVEFRGHIHDRHILRSLYRASFCAVSPGYVGLSAIQSFSFGVPMLIADKENHAPEIEACKQGINSVFFRSSNAADLADHLVLLWAERDIWMERRSAIAGWVAGHYSTDAMVDVFTSEIRRLQLAVNV
jgi:1,2-diacylglycerol 3-alpha-glucosyltransferase